MIIRYYLLPQKNPESSKERLNLGIKISKIELFLRVLKNRKLSMKGNKIAIKNKGHFHNF